MTQSKNGNYNESANRLVNELRLPFGIFKTTFAIAFVICIKIIFFDDGSNGSFSKTISAYFSIIG